MPDLFAFSDSCQAILDCCPFLWPTAGLVEAVCSFSAILFSVFSNLFLEHWSWYRYCSRYPYWLFWQNWFFCQENWRQLCLSWLGTQQEPGDLSQKVSSLMMKLSERDIDLHANLPFIHTVPISCYIRETWDLSLSDEINILFLGTRKLQSMF